MMRIIKIFVIFLFIIFHSPQGSYSFDIGLGWVGESGMAERVAEGFIEIIKEEAPDIRIEKQINLKSLDELSLIVNRWETDKDGIVILRSNGAKWLGQNPPSIPAFIGACSHPVLLGAVKHPGRTDTNITGVTYYLPKYNQFMIFREILPVFKSLLLITEKGHPSSEVDEDDTETICRKLNIAYWNIRCESQREILEKVEKLSDKFSAIYLGNQALISDNAKAIVKAAKSTPILSSNMQVVKDGGVCGFSTDDRKLGGILAASVIDVLVKNRPVRDIRIKIDSSPRLYINTETARKKGIKIPQRLKRNAALVR